MNRPLRILVSVLALSLPSIASAADSSVYECPGPSGTILYTNTAQSDCRPMTLNALTIAPTRTYSTSVDGPNYLPLDRYDYTAPIGSMRNRLVQGYPPQNLGDDPSQPPLGLGRGSGYPYQRFGGRLGQPPHGLGRGPGYPPQNFGSGLGQYPQGFGSGERHPPQSFSGASERPPQSFDRGAGLPPQKFGGGSVRETGRLR